MRYATLLAIVISGCSVMTSLGAEKEPAVFGCSAAPPPPPPSLSMNAMPAANQLATPDQEKLIGKWLAGDHKAYEQIEAQIKYAENEGLAQRLIGIVKMDEKHAAEASDLLAARAGTTNGEYSLGVDGAYLKLLASFQLDVMEGRFPAQKQGDDSGFAATGRQLAQVMVYLHFHPEDKAIASRAIAIARRDAQGTVTGARKDVPRLEISRAWAILIKLGALHDGMKLDEARQILGDPTQENKDAVSWYLPSPTHVNPGVHAKIKDGELAEWATAWW